MRFTLSQTIPDAETTMPDFIAALNTARNRPEIASLASLVAKLADAIDGAEAAGQDECILVVNGAEMSCLRPSHAMTVIQAPYVEVAA